MCVSDSEDSTASGWLGGWIQTAKEKVCIVVFISDATIYCPNDISSQYWPYHIVSISSRKISKFRFIVIVSISIQYRRNDVDVVYLFSFL